jgi:hypothetical protein
MPMLLLRSFWILLILSGPLTAAEINVTIPDKGSDGTDAINISLKGDIGPKDGKEFAKQLETAQRAVFERSHPDDIYSISSATLYLRIRLDLNSDNGGDFFAAMDIAEIVRREGIATIVKKGRVCASACAFIFLAGELHQPYSNDVEDRILEPGGYVFFHSPYKRGAFGTFAEGRKAVRRLLQVLGPRLPSDLAVDEAKALGARCGQANLSSMPSTPHS